MKPTSKKPENIPKTPASSDRPEAVTVEAPVSPHAGAPKPDKPGLTQVETHQPEPKIPEPTQPQVNKPDLKKTSATSHPATPTIPMAGSMTQKDKSPTSTSGTGNSKLLTLFALILAGVAVTISVLMWQRMAQMEQKLQASMDNNALLSDAAHTAKNLAQQSMDSAKDLQGRVSVLNTQLASANEDKERIDLLLQYASSPKTDMLPVNVRSMISSAELQMQLTGSVQPLLMALRSVDERLAEDGLSEQMPLRNAIATDIENIRNFPMPDPMHVSGQITELLDIVNKDSAMLPLVIDAPTSTPSLSLDLSLGEGPIPANDEPSADTSTWGTIKNAGSWTVDKAGELASATWTQLGSLVRITPLDSKDAVLLSSSEGALLRENIKMRLMGLRVAVLQKQYPQAQKELLEIQTAIETYFDVNNKNVQDVLRRIRLINADLQNVSLPKPSATLSALTTLNLNQ